MKPSTYAKFFLGNLSSQFTNKDDSKPLDQLLSETKSYYAAVLPRNADADTRVESVKIEDASLVFDNTLFTAEKDELDEDEFRAILTDVLKAEAHRLKRLRRILFKGGSLVYRYVDMNGNLVTEITLREQMDG
jgi:hypothetical protein